MRIVSLLPSATEMICALRLEAHLVGVTHECDFPPFVITVPKVTHTLIPTDSSSADIDRLVREQLRTTQALYRLDFPTLEQLRPDLIVTQALCDVCAVAEDEVRSAACALPGTPQVVSLEPQALSEVFDAIRHLAEITGVRQRGEEVVHGLKARVEAVAIKSAGLQYRPRVALLEWLDPPFSSGHWGPELVRLAGGVEGLGREGQRSRTLHWDEVMEWQPEVIVIACCGFSVERTLADLPRLWAVPGWSTLPAVRSDRVYVVDGSQYFSRPGPRLVDSLEILAHALHPDVHPLPHGLPPPLRVERSMRASHGSKAQVG
ncbi:cobalamin-binding protein [Candidatus Nitrospira inopinata]|jgi:iron complex transport system substrate-binding protein|uniref:ABC-type Fe3+-hydroxamate transport system,periplasmic component n=1 Tax=Candidatus Nitrospira inopinata TaxID=1715989 RepID=A0A0S4KQF2_9BACT|nr:cobalamin-binding protein [Candidatus Nitrospira inopinata]CUQ66583.1 ABC-type Fe3+-hydroxamate transport system,periplasmic component [Candidatus Nitrospira inopinata]